MRDNQPSNAAAPRREGRRFRAMLLLSLTALAGVAFAGLALGSSSVGAADVAAFVVGNASDMANNVRANVRVPRVLGGVPYLLIRADEGVEVNGVSVNI